MIKKIVEWYCNGDKEEEENNFNNKMREKKY